MSAPVLVGMSRMRHVERNVAALNMERHWILLDALLELLKPVANVCRQEGIPENYEPGSVPQQS